MFKYSFKYYVKYSITLLPIFFTLLQDFVIEIGDKISLKYRWILILAFQFSFSNSNSNVVELKSMKDYHENTSSLSTYFFKMEFTNNIGFSIIYKKKCMKKSTFNLPKGSSERNSGRETEKDSACYVIIFNYIILSCSV